MSKTIRFLPALLLAAGVMITAPACAARIYDYPRAYPPPPPPARVITRAEEVGYRDGVDAGRDDARHRERFDPVRSRRYRNADHDYDRRFGPPDLYAREYRAAFERGYRNGYDEYYRR